MKTVFPDFMEMHWLFQKEIVNIVNVIFLEQFQPLMVLMSVNNPLGNVLANKTLLDVSVINVKTVSMTWLVAWAAKNAIAIPSVV